MAAPGIEASSLMPKAVSLGYATPSVTGSSGNAGERAQMCSFDAMTPLACPLLCLSPSAVLAAGYGKVQKRRRVWRMRSR